MKVKLDIAKLNNIAKALENLPKAKVGILGGYAARDGINNAEIGLRHEFGYGVPKRSFLRVPLIDNFQRKLDESGLDGAAVFEAASSEEGFTPLIKEIGLVGEIVVAEGFRTEGYGKWQPHAPGYTNNTGMVLVDTQQLRDSISSEVA